MDLRALMLFLGFCSSVSPAEVRLVGGSSPCSGRLEQQRQSDWEPVRDQNWDWNLTAADQVCRRISCGSVVSLRRTLDQEPPTDVVTKYDFRAEVTLVSSFRVEITCSDSVRLENETHLCSGRLQVKWNQVWSSVCSDGFDLQDAEVVCRELGCGSPSGFEGKLYGEAPEWNTEFLCGGHESGLLHCDHSDRDTCSPGTTITLTCSDPGRVRLVEGSGRCDGTLELRNWGEWRPVDEPYGDLRSASMVCDELDCGSPVSTRRRETSSVDTWGFEFDCLASLINCFTKHETSSSIIELTCSAPDHVRLVGNSSTCAGELQMKVQGEWRPVVDEDWYLNQNWTSAAAAAVCSHLGCGSVVTTDLEGLGSVRPVWFIRSSCFQSAVSLQDCLVPSDEAKNSLSLQVICSDLLVQPNISVSPSHDEVQQQKVKVLMGSNFSIICSTRPQYPGGSFQLVFTSSSTTFNYVLPTVTHWAVFLFPAAEDLHRGTYTCIYHLNVFSYNFSSTSQSIYLIPSAPLMDLIIRLVVHLLVMVLLITVTCFYSGKLSVETRSRNEETNVLTDLQ
uniref:SRCR domain-containing protein n=1 Tax=Amphiprion ocellaris TaxID=80972 RepID=A0A3Q1D8H8_AMPOC